MRWGRSARLGYRVDATARARAPHSDVMQLTDWLSLTSLSCVLRLPAPALRCDPLDRPTDRYRNPPPRPAPPHHTHPLHWHPFYRAVLLARPSRCSWYRPSEDAIVRCPIEIWSQDRYFAVDIVGIALLISMVVSNGNLQPRNRHVSVNICDIDLPMSWWCSMKICSHVIETFQSMLFVWVLQCHRGVP